jgi:hypothetical protein
VDDLTFAVLTMFQFADVRAILRSMPFLFTTQIRTKFGRVEYLRSQNKHIINKQSLCKMTRVSPRLLIYYYQLLVFVCTQIRRDSETIIR